MRRKARRKEIGFKGNKIVSSSKWVKKAISKEEVEKLKNKFSLDSLTASIFVRSGITSGKDILYFMEDD